MQLKGGKEITVGPSHTFYEAPSDIHWYWDKGDLAIVSRTYAVADLRLVRFAGFIAWIV
jgi:NADH dehydrogenase FAD-containing subunit